MSKSRGSCSGGSAAKAKESHLRAMLKDQEDVAFFVYAKRIVGWRMHADDSPIEFALREYTDADEYDLDREERNKALAHSAKEPDEGFVPGFVLEDEEKNIHWVQIDNERVYANGARELFSFLFEVSEPALLGPTQPKPHTPATPPKTQMGWRERPKVELGVPIPDLSCSQGFVTIVGHGVGPLGTPMFRVHWSGQSEAGSKKKHWHKKGASGEQETWIHAYDTVGCPLALLEYVARENYGGIRLPRGLSVENFEAYVMENYGWDMNEPDCASDEDDREAGPGPAAGGGAGGAGGGAAVGADPAGHPNAPPEQQQQQQQKDKRRRRKRSALYGGKGRR